jgi:hypothetical protein
MPSMELGMQLHQTEERKLTDKKAQTARLAEIDIGGKQRVNSYICPGRGWDSSEIKDQDWQLAVDRLRSGP